MSGGGGGTGGGGAGAGCGWSADGSKVPGGFLLYMKDGHSALYLGHTWVERLLKVVPKLYKVIHSSFAWFVCPNNINTQLQNVDDDI